MTFTPVNREKTTLLPRSGSPRGRSASCLPLNQDLLRHPAPDRELCAFDIKYYGAAPGLRCDQLHDLALTEADTSEAMLPPPTLAEGHDLRLFAGHQHGEWHDNALSLARFPALAIS